MDADTAIDLRDVTFYNALSTSSLDWVGYNDGTAFPTPQAGTGVYGSGAYGEGMYYQVGFGGFLRDDSFGTPFPSVDIGAKANTNGVLDALQSLGSFNSYGLYIANDDDDTWEYRLYADTENSNYRSGTWTALTQDKHRFLTLTFPGAGLNFSGLTDIGFEIRATQDTDSFHTSVIPVPAAAVLAILGLSVAGIKLRKSV
jgi:hypothetical protein